MQLLPSELGTPVYLKTSEFEPWPQDKIFYLLTANGLFLCRNHTWFRSCVPAKSGPPDLAEQKTGLRLSYPVLPRALVEKAVAFFRRVYNENHWESALILLFNRTTQQLELLCPKQDVGFGSVDYKIPVLTPNLLLVGDLHSHCDFSPNPSMTDEGDELNRPGLHIIAGYLKDKKPTFYCVAIADGTRFKVEDPARVMEPFESDEGIEVPKEWMENVKHKEYSWSGGSYSGGGSQYSGSVGGYFKNRPSPADKEFIKNKLLEFLTHAECPTLDIARTALYMRTKSCSYLYCEKRAKQFIAAWPKAKGKYEKHLAQKRAAAAQAA